MVSGDLPVGTPGREYAVPAGQFFVAEPGSPHRAHAPADAAENARVVAVGAPSVADGHPYDG